MTRRSSVRAQAQEFYREMVEDDCARPSLTQDTPTPDPSPPLASVAGGGEDSAQGGGEVTDPPSLRAGETSLTTRVRALYEGSAVPVREIARLAGVTERTLYKYVERYGWTKRYRVKPRGEAAAAANRGRGWQSTPGFAPAKGAGGRFIRREDKGEPVAAGLKATDPAGEARAAAACADAQQRARRAEADAQAAHWHEETIRAMQAVRVARDDLAAHDSARKQRPASSTRAQLYERALTLSLKAALDWMEIAVGQWERAATASLEREPTGTAVVPAKAGTQ